jgi:hypothetical protein
MSAAERRCDDQSKRLGQSAKLPAALMRQHNSVPCVEHSQIIGPTRVGELPAARLLKKSACVTPDYYRTANHCFALVDRPRNPS